MKNCPGRPAMRLLPLLLGALLLASCSDDRDPPRSDAAPAPSGSAPTTIPAPTS